MVDYADMNGTVIIHFQGGASFVFRDSTDISVVQGQLLFVNDGRLYRFQIDKLVGYEIPEEKKKK